MEQMHLRWAPYTLALRRVFAHAAGSRTETPIILTRIDYRGVTGYGEASLPPYLGETPADAIRFLATVDLSRYGSPFRQEEILTGMDALAAGHTAAKAAVDIALHDLVGKLFGQPWYNIWGFSPEAAPPTSFTIGMDEPARMRERVWDAREYSILKVKLGGRKDREMIAAVRSVTDVPLYVDVNQGWTDREAALEMIHWLQAQGVILIEQPLPRERWDDMAWLTARRPLPTVADEAVQRLTDVPRAAGAYSGINIKLMKCTGMREAHRMLLLARALGLKVMIGCMTETSCAISAASHLAAMADWVDLDGALLAANDPFRGTTIVAGKLSLPERPGIGVYPVLPLCGAA